jgi:hypothetical protein
MFALKKTCPNSAYQTMQQEHEQDQILEEDQAGPLQINKLEECGISSSDISKLKEAGFHTSSY